MSLALDIGLSALQTHQRAMEVTSHNIANASTPGYSRQRSELTTPTPLDTRPGQVGRGVRVDAIRRISDDLITERLRSVQSETGRLNELGKVLADVEATFNEPGDAGLTSSTDRLYAAFEDLSNNPESNALRAGVIEQMTTYASIMNRLSGEFASQRDDLRFGISQQVDRINALGTQIATYNQSIRAELSSGKSPNDLMDQRDELLRQLSEVVTVDARPQADGGILVTAGGRLLIGLDSAQPVKVETDGEGNPIPTFANSGDELPVLGGRLHALIEVGNSTLPEIGERLDRLSMALAGAFNRIHSTATNDSFRQGAFVAERIIAADRLTTALDDTTQIRVPGGRSGMVDVQMPTYTEVDGTLGTRNLTVNVLDNASGLARKYVVRYEPGTQQTPAGRSLQDLVDAINTGTGGGFSVHPPTAGGIPDVQAKAIAVDGGFRLALEAAAGKSVDFSKALDLDITAGAWRSDAITVARAVPNQTNDIDFLANDRISAEVTGVDTTNGTVTLSLWTDDPVSGVRRALNAGATTTITVPFSGNATLLVDNRASPPVPAQYGLQFSAGGGDYVVGDSFAIDFSSEGRLLAADGSVGNRTVAKTWTDGAASVTIRGRYDGGQTYDPSRPWSMEVVQSGVVGARSGTPVPGNPPIVKFTYLTGPAEAPVQESLLVTLDQHFPAGSQVAIAEGVYAVFGSGQLYRDDPGAGDGNRLSFIVDGQPDQAGVLAALGVNSMFSGVDAGSFIVADALRRSPGNLLLGDSRASGDNSAVRRMADTRDDKLLTEDNATVDEYYQAVLSSVAVRINQTGQLDQNTQALEKSLRNRRDEVSGVSIDEEVGLLILQQQAYAAAARIISTERENIQTLLGILQ
jgi:flagellar hook-associated protein FlgK